MYRCHTQFYLIGCQRRMYEILKNIPFSKSFTPSFVESDTPVQAMIEKADVILADLQTADAAAVVRQLTAARKTGAELILLVQRKQIPSLSEYLTDVKDIWVAPMSDELCFRFQRWQEAYKMRWDAWEASQYLESTINSVPNLIWYKNRDGIHEKVNDSFCKTVGKTKAQVEGRGHAYIWDVEHDDPACIESELEVMRRRETCLSEETVQTGDGMRLLTTYKSPLYNTDGSVMGTVGVAIDVTQERAYAQELVRKTQTLETLFTSLDCGIMCHSLDGTHIISINRAALNILGYKSQKEMMDEGFQMIASSVLEEDRDRLYQEIASLKKVGENVGVEYRVRHADGKIVHVMGNIKLMQENGEMFYQRFLLDCTEQKMQETRKLMERERRQTELIQALAIDYNIVCFFDLDNGKGNALQINNCAFGILDRIFQGELSLESCMEEYIRICVYDDDKQMLRQAVCREHLREEIAKHKMYYLNYRTVCNGKIRYFQMKVVHAGEWNTSHGVVLGFRSIDGETRQEMKKKEMLENALLQANRASRAKSVFLSNMSHDIRTPMNAIIGFTNLAISHIGNREQVAAYLEKIQMSGDHLLSLINDVLDMSRIESGKMHIEEQPCSLTDLISELRSIVQADIQAKRLTFTTDMQDLRNDCVFCDNLRLNQVLLNLLSNAIKYTNLGGAIHLRVAQKERAPRGCAAYEFFIKDTGIGMSQEFLVRIFEPFERERNSTTSGIQGTGLGMSITKNIVDMMRGTIDVKSEPGVGTEVTISFIFQLCEESDAEETTHKLCTCGDGDSVRMGRILLAEDNELNQEIATAILEEAGFTVEIAENGQVAVEMLQKSAPGYYRIILMDIQMPVMNGYDAAKTIRKMENTKLASIPILAMTANAFEEDKQEALRSGMNGHIAKPIHIEKLMESLDQTLR